MANDEIISRITVFSVLFWNSRSLKTQGPDFKISCGFWRVPDKPSILIKLLGINIEKFKKNPKPPKPPKEKKEKVHPSINLALLNYDEPTSPKVVKPKEPPLNEEHKQIVEDYIDEKAKPKESLQEKINKIVNKITSVYNKVKDKTEFVQNYPNLVKIT